MVRRMELLINMAKLNKSYFTSQWEGLFRRKTIKALRDNMHLLYPLQRSITIDFKEIQSFDIKFSQDIIESPDLALEEADRILFEMTPPDISSRPGFRVRVRISNVKHMQQLNPGAIRDAHVGQLYSVAGRIKKAQKVQRKITIAHWQCKRCATITTTQIFDDELKLQEPLECSKDEGGCGSPSGRTRFKLLSTQSERVDLQIVHLEDDPNVMRGNQPESIRAFLWDDIVGVAPCNQAYINGIIKIRIEQGKQNAITETYIDVISLEILDKKDPVNLSTADVDQIKAISKRPNLFKTLRRSLAPSIHGHEIIKEALLLSIAGGVSTVLTDGTITRGQFHVLLVGDPAVAKTKLLEAVAEVAPIGLYGSGEGSTGAGLTCSFTKDEYDGRWTVDAGLLAMCDGGTACVDELDKLPKDEVKKLHSALEKQAIPYAKAGLVGSMNARTSLVAGANPKMGKFDPHRPLPDQIDLSPPLISRFDAIFTIRDIPDVKKDTAMAMHVLKIHREGLAGIIEEANLLKSEDLRKYLAYAQHIRPAIPEELDEFITNRYVDMRTKADGSETGITMRQFDAILRMSEASAKMRLSDIVNLDDVERAIVILNEFLKSVATAEDGTIDVTIISTGLGTSQRDRIWTMMETLKSIQMGVGASKEDLKGNLLVKGYPIDKFDEDFNRLKSEGKIFERHDGHFKIID